MIPIAAREKVVRVVHFLSTEPRPPPPTRARESASINATQGNCSGGTTSNTSTAISNIAATIRCKPNHQSQQREPP